MGRDARPRLDRAMDDQEVAAMRKTLEETSGTQAVHDIRTRKMGDMIVVDASLSLEAGHDMAVEARSRVMPRHRVLKLMTHGDPWRRPDLDLQLSCLNLQPEIEV